MCTLTYVRSGPGFIVTSNRDESIARERAIPPRVKSVSGVRLLMPQDPEKSGTWIAASERGRVAVLLNGAFQRHAHKPPYRVSRGIVLLDSFTWDTMADFKSNYDFSGIEPFTIIAIQFERDITDLRWDGAETHLSTTSVALPQVWCSAQMYPPQIQEATSSRFRAFLNEHPNPTPEDLVQFNMQEEYSDKMKRAGVQPFSFLRTVSISSIVMSPTNVVFKYHDLTPSDPARNQVFEVLMDVEPD
jgi:hypothetical protein